MSTTQIFFPTPNTFHFELQWEPVYPQLKDCITIRKEDAMIIDGKFDFGDGLVPARRHSNGGGIVALTTSIGSSAFVARDARVWGRAEVLGRAQIQSCARVCDRAKVAGRATIAGYAVVSGRGKVTGDAEVFQYGRVNGDASVSGKARVYDNGEVRGDASVSGKAKIRGHGVVQGDADVSGEAIVSDSAVVTGQAEIFGHARVYGSGEVLGTAKLSGAAFISDKKRIDEGEISRAHQGTDPLSWAEANLLGYGDVVYWKGQQADAGLASIAGRYLTIQDISRDLADRADKIVIQEVNGNIVVCPVGDLSYEAPPVAF
jgi:carbonic anhydrase/acetyltransferase-like protein (isoleucine patch superfamily)